MAVTLDNIKTIAVVGAGTMGAGIAQVCAMNGYQAILFDINEDAVMKARTIIEKNLAKGIEKGKITEELKDQTFQNITFTSRFTSLVADVIVEAIIERIDVKIELFQKLAAQNSDQTIFATNTSSIPITQIARDIPNAERVVGMHFFNPAHIMKLVEVISGAATSEEVTNTIFDLAEKLGKKAVIAKDAPGFIVNRVARHFYVESLKILEENVADHETVDNLLESSGFRMGPFRLQDLIGIDTNYSVTSSMFESFNFDSKFRPSRVQKQKVDAGFIGRKSGKGFYEY